MVSLKHLPSPILSLFLSFSSTDLSWCFLWTHCRPYSWFLQSSLSSFPNILSNYVSFLSLIHIFSMSLSHPLTWIPELMFLQMISKISISDLYNRHYFTNWRFVAIVGQASVLMTFFPTGFASHFGNSCNIFFSFLLYLLWWSMIIDLWCYYCMKKYDWLSLINTF